MRIKPHAEMVLNIVIFYWEQALVTRFFTTTSASQWEKISKQLEEIFINRGDFQRLFDLDANNIADNNVRQCFVFSCIMVFFYRQ